VGGQLIPAGVVALADYEAKAREALDDNAWAYLAGGAGDELTLAANREAWSALRLLPRVLRPLAGGDTRCTLFGRTFAHPLLLAPLAYQRLLHPSGELGSALAAAAQQAGMVLSAQASVAMETVAQAMHDEPARGPMWFQLYLQGDRGFDRALVQRAEAAGFEAIVLTVDAPVQGARDRERRAGFRLPADVSAVNLAGAPDRRAAPGASLFDGLLHGAPSWDDIDWLRAQTRLPLLLKGVLHADDARLAREHGAAGLIVSNHGGRTLDTAVSAAAPMCSRRSRSVPRRCSSAARMRRRWRSPVPTASRMCCVCCAMNSRSRWPCAAAKRSPRSRPHCSSSDASARRRSACSALL
jgi:4-hydroxymandelate oxidase